MTIKQRNILIFLIIVICFVIGFFVFANSQSNNLTVGQFSSGVIEQSNNIAIEQSNNRISDEPEFLSITANPEKVKVGDILTINL